MHGFIHPAAPPPVKDDWLYLDVTTLSNAMTQKHSVYGRSLEMMYASHGDQLGILTYDL